jgi:L-ascorbate metabolism protein UlaG (beta-lactamase superfamily)
MSDQQHSSITPRPRLCSACADIDLYRSLMIEKVPVSSGGVGITWLGTAGILVSDGATGILIDPYVSRFGAAAVFLGRRLRPDTGTIERYADRLGRKNISLILVTHSHFDHVADVPHFATITGAPVMGTESTLNVCRGAGLPETQLVRAGTDRAVKSGAFTVRFIESGHSPALFGRTPGPGTIDAPLQQPARLRDFRVGGTFSIHIDHPAGSILHHGSAGFAPDMYDGVTADVMLLGIAGRGNTEEYISRTVLAIRPRVLVLVHFDNLFRRLEKGITLLPNSRLGEFYNSMKALAPEIPVRTPPLFEAFPAFTCP